MRAPSGAQKIDLGSMPVNSYQSPVPGNIDGLITTLNDYDISVDDIKCSKNID